LDKTLKAILVISTIFLIVILSAEAKNGENTLGLNMGINEASNVNTSAILSGGNNYLLMNNNNNDRYQHDKWGTGWWLYPNQINVGNFLSRSNSMILLCGCGWYYGNRSVVTNCLDAIHKLNSSVIVGFNGGWSNLSQASDLMNTYKNYPATVAYYIADEPDLNTNQKAAKAKAAAIRRVIKAVDSRPCFISFSMYSVSQKDVRLAIWRTYYSYVEWIGMHCYPCWQGYAEFAGNDNSDMYNKWTTLLNEGQTYGKDVVATCQGFGDNTQDPYRTPTLNEMRYHAFSAVVQGIKKILFWMYDDWGNKDPVAVCRVATITAQIRSIEKEMMDGVTMDKAIKIDNDNIAYRYGVNGSRHILLCVNKSSNFITPNITIPKDVSSVTIIGEDRSANVTNQVLSDTFTKYAVHIYQF
jgi:hypothetical protein